jgi:hypothetical protein
MSSEKFTKSNQLKDELVKILKNLEKKVSSDDYSGETFMEARQELAYISEEIEDFGDMYGQTDHDFIKLREMEKKLSNLIENNELSQFI